MAVERVLHPLLWLLVTLLVATAGCPTNPTLIAPCDCNKAPSTIECIGKNLTALPLNLTQPFDELWIEGNNIKVITDVPYPTLTLLRMEYNHIETIQPGAFSKLKYLRTLNLANNNIHLTEAKVFEGLENLTLLNLEGNNIGELKDGAFTGHYLLSIMEIKLENCRLTKVDISAFNDLPTLQKLDLSNNKISKIPVFKFQNTLTKLERLDLSHNNLSELRNDTFHDLPALKHLDLSYNHIHIVRPSYSVFHAVQNTLETLYMGNNNMGPDMAFALEYMFKLATLDISFNNLSTLYPESLNWDPLKKLLINNNPWHCTCFNAWIINEEIIRESNPNTSVRCAYPEKVKGQNAFAIDPHQFVCDGPSAGMSDALGVSIACIVCILVIIGVAYFLYRRTEKWRLKRRGLLIPSVSSQYKRVKDDQRAQLVF